jgi:hypothetical protein
MTRWANRNGYVPSPGLGHRVYCHRVHIATGFIATGFIATGFIFIKTSFVGNILQSLAKLSSEDEQG